MNSLFSAVWFIANLYLASAKKKKKSKIKKYANGILLNTTMMISVAVSPQFHFAVYIVEIKTIVQY